jgi:hypothetical protein
MSSPVEELLIDVLGSAEAVPPFAEWAREQNRIGDALWNNELPENERLRALAEVLRGINTDDDGKVALLGLANLLDPDIDDGSQKLVFAHRRVGNPKSADGSRTRIERMFVVMDAHRPYQEILAQGRSPHGLKKLVSDVIGKRYGKKGSTIDKVWHPPRSGDPWPPLEMRRRPNKAR